MAKETLLQTMWIGFGEDGIIRVRILPGVNIDLQQAKLMNEAMVRLAGEGRFPVLVDARVTYSSDKDAQEYISQNSGFRSGTAILTNNPVSRLLSNSYVRIFKPGYPSKIFSSEEKAVAWLKSLE